MSGAAAELLGATSEPSAQDAEPLRDLLGGCAEMVDEYERAGRFPAELFRRVMATGLAEPVIAGRAGAVRAFCANVEVVAENWLALAESVHLQTLVALTLARHARPRVRDELVSALTEGRMLGANCVSEAAAGSDMSAIELRAERTGDEFRLHGTKTWAGHAPVAGVFIVYARTSDAGLGGLTCFAVDAAAEGVTVAPAARKHSAAALPSADVVFDGVAVPVERVLGRVNRGARVADDMFTQGRVGLAACAVGLAAAALRRATAYAKSRIQFGVPIIRHQAVGHLLADMSTQLAAARQLLHRACAEIDAGGPEAGLLAAQAKLFATDTAMRVTTDAVQVLGASAYLPGEAAERWMREAKLLQIIQGTNQIQRNAIAARL
ncbi:acyl-CoA dehydrogenase family protein [Nocardia beijingensis]|uniref:acyl-CoA dehydrogenase family protein n=1 Tax=Nocardia beijingensis TaxID=95162 RepID=UPI0008376655|nr:acyl-CoA dehydrogenase family protein [Nocardia beijingensis]